LKVLLPLLLVLALVGIFAGSLWNALSPVQEVSVLPVVERPAIKRRPDASADAPGSAVIQAAGWIEPDPFPTAAAALIDGTVSEVLVREGTAVKAGDVLARLVPDDARLALARAEAEFAAAEENWKSNIAAPRNLATTEAMFRETSATLAMIRAERDGEQALLAEADRVLARRSALRASGSVSETDLTAAVAEQAMREAKVRAMDAQLEALRASLDARRAEHRAAVIEAELRTEDRLRLELARVALAEAKLTVARLEVRSPIDGVVMARLVEPGARLMIGGDNPAGAYVAQLYDPAHLQVRVDVPLAEAGRISVGQRADVVVEIFPDRVIAGTVLRVTNLANIEKNTLEMKVRLEAPAPGLKPEMLARVRFLKATSDGPMPASSIFVPPGALKNGRAWVVEKFDGEIGVAAPRIVQATGADAEGWLEIETGLQPGDLVVVSDPDQLVIGRRVRASTGKGEPSHGLH
jgi:RND family efflux transporter MFP subunit